jgi:ABC-type proline/glycine betaine transport system permease subunit
VAGLFACLVMAIVALPAFAALREHGTRFSKALSWMFLAFGAIPALALVGVILQVIFGS